MYQQDKFYKLSSYTKSRIFSPKKTSLIKKLDAFPKQPINISLTSDKL